MSTSSRLSHLAIYFSHLDLIKADVLLKRVNFPNLSLYVSHYVSVPCFSISAFLSCAVLAVALFGFLSSSANPLLLLFALPLCFSLLNAEFSLLAIDLCFLSSQPPPTLMLQCLLNQARALLPTASLWAYWEAQSWDCLNWRRVTGSQSSHTNRYVVIF